MLSIILVGLLNAPLELNASDFVNGTIEAVRPDNFDVGGVFVFLSGSMSGAQTCTFPNGTSSNYYFISKNNPLMKELLAAALSAKLSEKAVTVVGKGVCTQGYEDVRYIEIH
jgi:hypothetical protein